MGVIARQIQRMKPQLEYILETYKKVDTSTNQRDLEVVVDRTFDVLKPFSHEFRDLRVEFDGRYYRDRLCLGTNINLKGSGDKYGRSISKAELIGVIKQHGRLIQTEVRGPIKDDFLRLVELTEQLIPYETIEVERNLQQAEVRLSPSGNWLCKTKPTTIIQKVSMGPYEKKVEFEPLLVPTIWLKTPNPDKIILSKKDGVTEESIDVDAVYYLHMMEDILPDIVELYKEAERVVGQVQRHNEPILTQMEQTVMPWRIAKELK
jgi:hypothetical protein